MSRNTDVGLGNKDIYERKLDEALRDKNKEEVKRLIKLIEQDYKDELAAKEIQNTENSAGDSLLDLQRVVPAIGIPENGTGTKRDNYGTGCIVFGKQRNNTIKYEVPAVLLEKNVLIINAEHRSHFYCMVKKSKNDYIIIDTLNHEADYQALQNAVKEKNPDAKFEVISSVHNNGRNNCAVHAIVNAELAMYALEQIKTHPHISNAKVADLIKTNFLEQGKRAEYINYYADNILRPNLPNNTDSARKEIETGYNDLMTNLKEMIDINVKKLESKKREQSATKEKSRNLSDKNTPTKEEEINGISVNLLKEFYKEDLVEDLIRLNLVKNGENEKIDQLLKGCDKLIDSYIKELKSIAINTNTAVTTELKTRDNYLEKITNQVFKNLSNTTPAIEFDNMRSNKNQDISKISDNFIEKRSHKKPRHHDNKIQPHTSSNTQPPVSVH